MIDWENTLKHHRKKGESDHKLLLRLYNKAGSSDGVARLLLVSITSVSRKMKSLGIKLKGRQYKSKLDGFEFGDKNPYEIAKDVDMAVQSVYRYVRRNKIDTVWTRKTHVGSSWRPDLFFLDPPMDRYRSIYAQDKRISVKGGS